jgi:hypothetical protein
LIFAFVHCKIKCEGGVYIGVFRSRGVHSR